LIIGDVGLLVFDWYVTAGDVLLADLLFDVINTFLGISCISPESTYAVSVFNTSLLLIFEKTTFMCSFGSELLHVSL
jgi:hypothetical protein